MRLILFGKLYNFKDWYSCYRFLKNDLGYSFLYDKEDFVIRCCYNSNNNISLYHVKGCYKKKGDKNIYNISDNFLKDDNCEIYLESHEFACKHYGIYYYVKSSLSCEFQELFSYFSGISEVEFISDKIIISKLYSYYSYRCNVQCYKEKIFL